jgi:hypothetical protein
MNGFDVDVPILSRGKHRNPRKGACFMEFASYLAGERWSDHPACTHPLLAAVARQVNDATSDTGRGRLGRLIPSVIGLTGTDPHLEPRLTLRCIWAALPVASEERQRVLVVALLRCEQVLAELDGRPAGSLGPESRQALAAVPHAERWARQFISLAGGVHRQFRSRAAERTVACAVQGIAEACIEDPDPLLHDLLVTAIEETTVWTRPEQEKPRVLAEVV